MQEFCRLRPPLGTLGLWWLGQSGFVVRGVGTTVVIDPYLSTGLDRVVPVPIGPEKLSDVDVLICTHEHIDHLDPTSVQAIAKASPAALIVVPTPIVSMVLDLGIAPDRVIDAQPGRRIECGGVTLDPVAACHGTDVAHAYDFGEAESDGMVRFLGFVLEMNGVRAYHAGDTAIYDGLEATLRDLRIDVALLPINGRDYFREAQNLVGNMDAREAVTLAARIDVDGFIPMHYDMFAGNLGDPASVLPLVRQQHASMTVLYPCVDKPFAYTRLLSE